MTLHTDTFRGDRFTIATRHPAFGVSLNRGGRVLHRVKVAYAYWQDGDIQRFGASWLCDKNDRVLHPSCANVALVDDAAGHDWCINCDIHLPAIDRTVRLYVMRVGGMVKAGRSIHPQRRAHGLGGDLVATAPGSVSVELDMLTTIRRTVKAVAGREWFPPDAEAACVAAMHAASQRQARLAAHLPAACGLAAPALPAPQRVEGGGNPSGRVVAGEVSPSYPSARLGGGITPGAPRPTVVMAARAARAAGPGRPASRGGRL